jgi:hypothetical protein
MDLFSSQVAPHAIRENRLIREGLAGGRAWRLSEGLHVF